MYSSLSSCFLKISYNIKNEGTTDLWLGRGWGIRVLNEDLVLLWTGCHHGAGSTHHHSTTSIDGRDLVGQSGF